MEVSSETAYATRRSPGVFSPCFHWLLCSRANVSDCPQYLQSKSTCLGVLDPGHDRDRGTDRLVLEGSEFQKFFDYVEVANFEVASDAFTTFKVNTHTATTCRQAGGLSRA